MGLILCRLTHQLLVAMPLAPQIRLVCGSIKMIRQGEEKQRRCWEEEEEGTNWLIKQLSSLVSVLLAFVKRDWQLLMDMWLPCPTMSITWWACVFSTYLCAREGFLLPGYSAECGSVLYSRDGPWGNQSSAVLCGRWLCILWEEEMKGTREVRKRQERLLSDPLQEGWNLSTSLSITRSVCSGHTSEHMTYG